MSTVNSVDQVAMVTQPTVLAVRNANVMVMGMLLWECVITRLGYVTVPKTHRGITAKTVWMGSTEIQGML